MSMFLMYLLGFCLLILLFVYFSYLFTLSVTFWPKLNVSFTCVWKYTIYWLAFRKRSCMLHCLQCTHMQQPQIIVIKIKDFFFLQKLRVKSSLHIQHDRGGVFLYKFMAFSFCYFPIFILNTQWFQVEFLSIVKLFCKKNTYNFKSSFFLFVFKRKNSLLALIDFPISR